MNGRCALQAALQLQRISELAMAAYDLNRPSSLPRRIFTASAHVLITLLSFVGFFMIVARLRFPIFSAIYIHLIHCDIDEQPTPSEVDDKVALGE